MNKFNFGVMQGRPWKSWQKEFHLAKKLRLKLIEWTLDNKNFYKNPLLNSKYFEKIKNLSEKNNIRIESVTCDFFMEKPYFKQNKKNQIEIKKKNTFFNKFLFNFEYKIYSFTFSG